jgi:hypothetical protein
MNRLFSALIEIGSGEGQANIPTGSATESTVQTALQTVFGIFAAIALLMVVISAFRMVLSKGNSESFGKARDSVIYSVVGLVISLSAFVIVAFVVERI